MNESLSEEINEFAKQISAESEKNGFGGWPGFIQAAMLHNWGKRVETLEESTPSNMVLIDVTELEELQNDAKFLNCLYSAGVDNWEGYSEAQNMLED